LSVLYPFGFTRITISVFFKLYLFLPAFLGTQILTNGLFMLNLLVIGNPLFSSESITDSFTSSIHGKFLFSFLQESPYFAFFGLSHMSGCRRPYTSRQYLLSSSSPGAARHTSTSEISDQTIVAITHHQCSRRYLYIKCCISNVLPNPVLHFPAKMPTNCRLRLRRRTKATLTVNTILLE